MDTLMKNGENNCQTSGGLTIKSILQVINKHIPCLPPSPITEIDCQLLGNAACTTRLWAFRKAECASSVCLCLGRCIFLWTCAPVLWLGPCTFEYAWALWVLSHPVSPLALMEPLESNQGKLITCPFFPKKTAYNEKAPIWVEQEPVPLCCCCCYHSYPWGLSLC